MAVALIKGITHPQIPTCSQPAYAWHKCHTLALVHRAPVAEGVCGGSRLRIYPSKKSFLIPYCHSGFIKGHTRSNILFCTHKKVLNWSLPETTFHIHEDYIIKIDFNFPVCLWSLRKEWLIKENASFLFSPWVGFHIWPNYPWPTAHPIQVDWNTMLSVWRRSDCSSRAETLAGMVSHALWGSPSWIALHPMIM